MKVDLEYKLSFNKKNQKFKKKCRNSTIIYRLFEIQLSSKLGRAWDICN